MWIPPKFEDIPEKPADLLFPQRRRKMSEGICAVCEEKIHGFRDELSEREFLISGLCQKCQDKTF